MSSILLILGKACFLLIAIGFFLPVAYGYKKASRNSGYSRIDFSNDYERDPRDICP